MKNIVLDIGSIIFYFDEGKVPELMSNDPDEQKFIYENLVISPEWTGYNLLDTGLITISDAITLTQDRTNHLNDNLVFKFWHHYLDSGYVSSDVLLLIKNLMKQGYKVYLLSNMSTNFYDMMDTAGLFDLVDGYVLSFQEHALKPYTEIYKILIDRYNLDVLETLFLDDMNRNIETAKLLGLNAEVVKANNYEDLVNKLEKYDIKIN